VKHEHRETIDALLMEAVEAGIREGTPRGRARAAPYDAARLAFHDVLHEVQDLRQFEADQYTNDT